MFGLLKTLIISVIVLFAVTKVIPGVSYQDDISVLLQAALVFSVIQVIIVPLLNLLAVPLNLLSFGLASMIINAGLFYAISYVVPAFTFSPFDFPGYVSGALVVPAFSVPQYGTVLLASLVVSIFQALLRQILHD